MSDIKISFTAARWILRTAVTLISHVFNEEYDPENGTFSPYDSLEDTNLPRSIYDRLDREDSELMYWANALIQFAKSVAGIVSYNLRQAELMDIQITPFDDEETL